MGKLRHPKLNNLPNVTHLLDATAGTQALVVWLHEAKGYHKHGSICVCVCVCYRERYYHFFKLQMLKQTFGDMLLLAGNHKG